MFLIIYIGKIHITVQTCSKQVFHEESLLSTDDDHEQRERFRKSVDIADVFLGSAVKCASTAEWISSVVWKADVKTRFVADCPPGLSRVSLLGKYRPEPPVSPLMQMLPDFLRDLIGGPNSGTVKDRKLWSTLQNFYWRNSSEDLTFLSLVLVDRYSKNTCLVFKTSSVGQWIEAL